MTRRDDFLRAAERCDRAAERGWIDEDIATLLREAAELAWQPIETAPKDGTSFIAYSPMHGVAKEAE